MTKNTFTTPRITATTESTKNSINESKADIWRQQMIDTSSAPSTPTGSRNSMEAYKPEVPILPVRVSSFGSDALSCCTPDYPERGIISVSSSFSSSATNSTNLEGVSNNSIRNVNLYDLIDEEFVVNCGASLAKRHKRSNSHSSDTCTTRPGHRRRKSILDMIDRIVPSNDGNTSVMTTRSYPRGVYVVPPTERETSATGNTVAFVSAEAYKQW